MGKIKSANVSIFYMCRVLKKIYLFLHNKSVGAIDTLKKVFP